jgi:hypothetical protein
MPLYRDPLKPSNLYEVVKVQTCSGQPLEVTTASGDTVYVQPGGTAGDAFGRLRISQPFTIFDSQHRYQENDKWSTLTGVSGTTTYRANESVVDLNVTTRSGDYIYRETKRVFPYQPGKSFLNMSSFVFASGKANLRQRVGLFGAQNGIFFEQSGNTNYLVLRSYISGSVNETRVAQSGWNTDTFNGSGVTGRNLDPTKANIFWMDIEWLGVGDVRAGFVVDGHMQVAHTFHNDNQNATSYMTTAVLPLRQEIENLGTTASSSTAKQICATVASEGGYEGFSRRYNVALGTTEKNLAATGVSYPVISLRLSSSRLDSVIVPSNLNAIVTSNQNVQFRVILNPTLSGANWTTHYNGNVEYDMTASGMSGGTDILGGYIQNNGTLDITSINSFNFQLGRTQAGVSDIFSVIMVPTSPNTKVLADLSWFEIV